MAVDAARAKSLLLAASDLDDPAKRAAYLDRECGGDAELRARLEALLRASDAAPPPRPGERTVDSAPGRSETVDYGDPTARLGALLAGKYKLVEEIGEGGMGSVFMAQQTEPVRRAVAVKVIKAGMDSKAVLARFEAERQALAMMDHPNIARVLDAGTTDGGRPFFVMELVKGTPITRLLRRAQAHPAAATGTVRAGLPGHSARAPEGDHPPRHQAVERAGGTVRRPAGAQGHRLRRGQGGGSTADRQDADDRVRGRSSARRVHVAGAGQPEQPRISTPVAMSTRWVCCCMSCLTGTTPVDRKSLGKAALVGDFADSSGGRSAAAEPGSAPSTRCRAWPRIVEPSRPNCPGS